MALTKIREIKDKPEPVLNDRKRRFAQEYALDFNSTRAAIAAGYKKTSASVMAVKLLKDPVVMKEIARFECKTLNIVKLDKVKVLEQLYYLATRSIHEFVDDEGNLLPAHKLSVRAAACVDSIKQKTRTFTDHNGEEQTVTEVEYKLSGKATAIDMAMKHFGQYAAEQHDHKHAIVNWDELFTKDEPSGTTLDQVEYRIQHLEEKPAVPPTPDTNTILNELIEGDHDD